MQWWLRYRKTGKKMKWLALVMGTVLLSLSFSLVGLLGGAAPAAAGFSSSGGVASLSPASGPPDTALTITGSGFGAVGGSVYFDENTVSVVQSAYSVWSDTQVVTSVPSGLSAGPVDVAVYNGTSGNLTVSQSFTLTPWQVAAGASSPRMALQGLGFYPGVITVDAGDSVTWTIQSGEPHMIDFLNGPPPPPSGWPGPTTAASTYGGAWPQDTSVLSPMLFQGQSYTMTFPVAGVYLYQCLMHPGMYGVVVVQAAGTPYPHDQAYYTGLGQTQAAADLAAAGTAESSYRLTSAADANGTTVWTVANGISPPETATVSLAPPGGSGTATGTATLNGTSGGLNVSLSTTGLPSGSYTASLGWGLWNNGSVEAAAYAPPVSLGSLSGNGTLDTVVNGVYAVPETGAFLEVTGTSGNPVLGGEAAYNNATVMRYLPPVLVVHQGDTVNWVQMAPQEVHTVTFLNGSAESAVGVSQTNPFGVPTGGSVFTPGAPMNSGPEYPGQTYSLTFDNVGVFPYKCLLHDYMGQVGVVVVEPAGAPAVQPSATSVITVNNSVDSTGTSTTTATAGDITGGELLVSDYASGADPVTGALSAATGTYFDVLLTNAALGSSPSVTISQYVGSSGSGDTLDWWNGTAWEPVSPSATYVNGYLSVTLNGTSSPSLAQLNGTPFAVAGPVSWQVAAGASSPRMALQGLGFYPGVITVDAGDSVTWTIQSGEP
ncbi:MAG: plastocyanin/azurin family copper-binding protein, partial [Peptococcaceae bacterium]|nr:plastocyanin/azurin family copper-binding protein [Peptococcaceae bacterium]